MTDPERQATDSTMDALSERAREAKPVITFGKQDNARINEILDRRIREDMAKMAQDPDNFVPPSLVWLLGDIVVLEGDRWISVVDQRPVPIELVHKYGRVLRHDPTVTPADEYDANAIPRG